jgi:hypothetical protein
MRSAKMLARDGVKAKSYGRAAAGLDTVSSRLMTGLSVVLILNSLGAQHLLREVFSRSADMEITDGVLHVRIDPLSAPRRTRALAALCEDLSATTTIYPGTDLVLAYTVKDAPAG